MIWTCRKGATNFPERPCLGERTHILDGEGKPKRGQYEWQTYAQVNERMHNVGKGLRNLGLVPNTSKVGIYSLNRSDWAISDLGAISQALPVVSIYDTLGDNVVEYVVNHAELELVFTEKEKTPILFKVKKQCPALKFIVQFEPCDVDQLAEASTLGIGLFSIDELEAEGKKSSFQVCPPKPDDMATIMYTSGTTGNPKGVILTHSNIVAAECAAYFHEPTFQPSENDVHLSYLPLAHIFERVVQAGMFAFGGAVGFYQGSVSKMLDDLHDLKPTIWIGVPRIFNRLRDRILSKLNEDSKSAKLGKSLFMRGMASKRASLRKGERPSKVWHQIIFHGAKHKLGGRVRGILSGSAPLDPVVHEFLELVFCCPVVQGYGLTETSAATCIQNLGDDWDVRYGHVGAPACVNEIKLVDVGELNYFVSDYPCPRGEVCIRGPNVFKGYYKEPEKTAEVLDTDGWFHTGDIGKLNENGTLSIIDRKKNIFKLSQGEYVAVEVLEGIYQKSDWSDQIWVYGNSYQSTLIAVVVPDESYLLPWCQKNGIPLKEGTTRVYNKVTGQMTDPVNMALACSNSKVQKMLLSEIQATGRANNVKGFERISGLLVEWDRWTPANDLLTPSMKLRRNKLLEKYQAGIDELYVHIEKGDAGTLESKLDEAAIVDMMEKKIFHELHPEETTENDPPADTQEVDLVGDMPLG